MSTTDDATPEEARAILEELARRLDAPAPLEDCPFSLTPPARRPRRITRQPGLFEPCNSGD